MLVNKSWLSLIKQRKMKRLITSLVLVFFGISVFSQPSGRKMPVTAASGSALSLYTKAMEFYDDVNIEKAKETFEDALREDPDLFMANYQLAMYYLMNESPEEFMRYSDEAINCKSKLDAGEKILREALSALRNRTADVTEYGRRLVEMYPSDPNSYNSLISFQSLTGDIGGMVETVKKAISIADDPSPFYNQLGYGYLSLKEEEKAGEAFDKYISLDPMNPNVYDSKGDYFMYVKEYDRAYESYMKAHLMDPSFSEEKARMAKQLYEKEKGRKLQIIPM